MAAYAHYQNNKYDDAIVAVDRFIQLNPSNRDVGYAYYLKALCYYEQITDVQRDARMTELALRALEEVVTRFPDTIGAADRARLAAAYRRIIERRPTPAAERWRTFLRERYLPGATEGVGRHRLVRQRGHRDRQGLPGARRQARPGAPIGLSSARLHSGSVLG